MATDQKKIHEYANNQEWRRMPEKVEGLGNIASEDGQLIFTIAFSTYRDLITEIGFSAQEGCPEAQCACVAAICELAADEPVMAAELLGPQEIAGLLSDNGELDDETFYFSVLATLALKNALIRYAAYRKADMEAWRQEQASQKQDKD